MRLVRCEEAISGIEFCLLSYMSCPKVRHSRGSVYLTIVVSTWPIDTSILSPVTG
jgi:hypothetical protein